MGVALGGLNLAMAKKPLNLIKTPAVVDKETGITVPNIMHPPTFEVLYVNAALISESNLKAGEVLSDSDLDYLFHQSRWTKFRTQWWWRNRAWVTAWYRTKLKLGRTRKRLADPSLVSNRVCRRTLNKDKRTGIT